MSPSLYLNNIPEVRRIIAQRSLGRRCKSSPGLGPTVPELNVNGLGSLHLGTFDKTLFSMIIPKIDETLKERCFESVLIIGIEVRASALGASRYTMVD